MLESRVVSYEVLDLAHPIIVLSLRVLHMCHAAAPQACTCKTGIVIGVGGFAGMKAEKLMDLEEVYEAALRAKDSGSTRFCMGAAWRGPTQVCQLCIPAWAVLYLSDV